MTPLADVFPVICPSRGTGTGLAPACWPDQKPVRPSRGVTRHSSAARGSTPQTGTGTCPPHRDAHALAVVEVRTVVVFEAAVAADSGGYAEALGLAERQAPARRAFAVE